MMKKIKQFLRNYLKNAKNPSLQNKGQILFHQIFPDGKS